MYTSLSIMFSALVTRAELQSWGASGVLDQTRSLTWGLIARARERERISAQSGQISTSSSRSLRAVPVTCKFAWSAQRAWEKASRFRARDGHYIIILWSSVSLTQEIELSNKRIIKCHVKLYCASDEGNRRYFSLLGQVRNVRREDSSYLTGPNLLIALFHGKTDP